MENLKNLFNKVIDLIKKIRIVDFIIIFGVIIALIVKNSSD